MGLTFPNDPSEPITLPAHYPSLSIFERRKVRDLYSSLQGGKCYHCEKALHRDPVSSVVRAKINWDNFPENFLDHPIHLHHDHDTGMTLGTVHAHCNAYLCQYLGE
jgi:hypothetical protein